MSFGPGLSQAFARNIRAITGLSRLLSPFGDRRFAGTSLSGNPAQVRRVQIRCLDRFRDALGKVPALVGCGRQRVLGLRAT